MRCKAGNEIKEWVLTGRAESSDDSSGDGVGGGGGSDCDVGE